jgi:hypothetical protein
MAESTTALPGKRRIGLAKRSVALETLTRLVRYIFTRGIALFLAAVIGVYLTILIANMGGYVDQIKIGEIREQVGASVLANPALQGRPASEIKKYVEEQVQLEIKRLGLDKPFILRSFGYLTTALSLSLGRSEHLTSDSGSREVRLILLERLPATLLLWGLSDLFLFFASVLFALYLSRRYGSFFDRAVIALAPTSAAPPWFLWDYPHLDLRLGAPNPPLWWDRRCPAAEDHIGVYSERIQTPSAASLCYYSRLDLHHYLQLAHLLPDLLQRGLCGDGQGQGTLLRVRSSGAISSGRPCLRSSPASP